MALTFTTAGSTADRVDRVCCTKSLEDRPYDKAQKAQQSERRRHRPGTEIDVDADTATDIMMCMYVRKVRTAMEMSHTVYGRVLGQTISYTHCIIRAVRR